MQIENTIFNFYYDEASKKRKITLAFKVIYKDKEGKVFEKMVRGELSFPHTIFEDASFDTQMSRLYEFEDGAAATKQKSFFISDEFHRHQTIMIVNWVFDGLKVPAECTEVNSGVGKTVLVQFIEEQFNEHFYSELMHQVFAMVKRNKAEPVEVEEEKEEEEIDPLDRPEAEYVDMEYDN